MSSTHKKPIVHASTALAIPVLTCSSEFAAGIDGTFLGDERYDGCIRESFRDTVPGI